MSARNTLPADRLKAWIELCRLPLVLVAMADPLAGALIAGADGWHAPGILLAMLVSGCLFAGGAVLNDWHDFRNDLKAKPARPLPSRRIRRVFALPLAIGLLSLGGGLTTLIGARSTSQAAWLLIAVIIAYNILLKHIPIAPALLGICRALNLMLGMTLVPAGGVAPGWGLRVYVALTAAVYTVGVAAFARRETRAGQGRPLAIAAAVAWMATLVLATVPIAFPRQGPCHHGLVWLAGLLALCGFRMGQAILTPTAPHIRRGARAGVLGVLLFDAAAVAHIRGLPLSLVVLVLLPPAFCAAKWLDADHPLANTGPSTHDTVETRPPEISTPVK